MPQFIKFERSSPTRYAKTFFWITIIYHGGFFQIIKILIISKLNKSYGQFK
jgi:hypothetical protein